jgi:two-component system copper resistance phosphate regulon response regulator CusR
MKILVVEDEPKTGNYLRQGMVKAGFVVDLARSGIDGLHFALTEHYQLAILDVMLPGIDGWQVLQSMRSAGNQIPVLFLTAHDEVDERVKGLELGADDFWLNPLLFPSCGLPRPKSHFLRCERKVTIRRYLHRMPKSSSDYRE